MNNFWTLLKKYSRWDKLGIWVKYCGIIGVMNRKIFLTKYILLAVIVFRGCGLWSQTCEAFFSGDRIVKIELENLYSKKDIPEVLINKLSLNDQIVLNQYLEIPPINKTQLLSLETTYALYKTEIKDNVIKGRMVTEEFSNTVKNLEKKITVNYLKLHMGLILEYRPESMSLSEVLNLSYDRILKSIIEYKPKIMKKIMTQKKYTQTNLLEELRINKESIEDFKSFEKWYESDPSLDRLDLLSSKIQKKDE